MSDKKQDEPRPPDPADGKTPLGRTADLLRRIVQVPKSDLPNGKTTSHS